MYPETTPVVAPVAGLFPGAGASREWSSGLFDCFDDCDNFKHRRVDGRPASSSISFLADAQPQPQLDLVLVLGCMTFWCPCITFGRTAEIVDHGTTSCGTSATLFALIEYLSASWCTWAYSCTYRGRMRKEHGLPEAPCSDFVVHLCCLPCALCQEYRELKARGYEPILGWEFNAQRAAAGVAMSAPAAQGMGR